MKLIIATLFLFTAGCAVQPEKTHTNSRTQPSTQASDPSSDNAKPKTSGGSSDNGSDSTGSTAPDKDGFTLAENVLITTIAAALNMKPEEIALLKNLLANNRAAIKPLADMIGKLASKEIAAFVKGKFVEMSVHEDVLAKVSYLLGHTTADKSPVKSLRIESDGVTEDQMISIVTGEYVSFRAVATYADGSERDITNLVLWELDGAANGVTQDSLSRYRVRGDKDGASGKLTARLQWSGGDLSAAASLISHQAVSQTYEMFVEKDGEAKTSLPLGLFFKVKILAKVVDIRGKTIATVDKTDTTPVTLTQSAADPLVVRSTVFGSPIYRSIAKGTQNFSAQIEGQQLTATLAITPAVELFKYISGSEDNPVIPFEECGSVLKNDGEKTAVSADNGVRLVGDTAYLSLYSVLSTCEGEPVENVKFLPADVYIPTETPGYYVLGKVRSPDQAGSVTTAAGQPIATLNKLTSEVRAKELTAVVFSENLAEKVKCDSGPSLPDQASEGAMWGTISKSVYAVFNECRTEIFDTADSGAFEITGMNPANILSVGALHFGQIDFSPNPARGLQEQTVVVTIAVNLAGLCHPADTVCIAAAQRTVTQEVKVPGAVPVDIAFSESGLSCAMSQGKPSPEPEFVRAGQTINLALFYTPLGTDSNGNCLPIPFSEAMTASTQLEVPANITLTGWTLTVPQDGDFQVTARYTSGNETLTTSRFFIVESAPVGGGDYEQVRPIFEARCQTCHNQVAPDLGSLNSIISRRDMILQSIVSGRMPVGSMLSAQEKDLLIAFLEGSSGDGGGTSSDLNIRQTREDNQHQVKVDMIRDGAVVRSETFDSPGKGRSVTLTDFCSQKSTCLRVTFIGSITQVTGSAQCVFVAPQADNSVKIDVDTRGAGIFGACKPDEDETYYFSCPDSAGSLKVTGCNN